MSESLGSAYINIVPKAPGIEGQIEGLLGGPAASAGGSAGGKAGSAMLGGLKKVFAVAAVGKVIKDAFSAGGDLQQSFGGLETIYGNSAGIAKEFAKQAAEMGISANDYAEQAVSFGASLKQAFGGNTYQAVVAANTAISDMADNAAKMGTPIESLQNAYQGFAKQNYTMLDNLKLGYGGTKTEMERLLKDAQELSGVEYNIENLGDVYSAIHVIQEELGLTGVAAQEAQTTLTGSFGAVKASWQNVLAALTTGEGLQQAMQNLTTSFSNFATNILTMLGNLAPQLPTLIIGLVNTIVEQAPAFLSAGIQLIGDLAVGLANALPNIIGQIPELFGKVVQAILSVDWLGVGSAIINGIIEGLKAAASNLWESVKSIARDALAQLKSELGIGSPSRVFADEVGHWIPPGIAVGIDENLSPLNASFAGLVNDMTSQFDRVTSSGATYDRVSAYGAAIDYERLAAAISSRPVVIQGDTNKIFRVVRQTNNVRTKATNYNALGALT